MIEKFLEKFLPQITERVNENAELGQALIETLAVLDNYATLNNVQFTDEQVNAMLGTFPEPEPEPNADVPAKIEQIVESKKRGRKSKGQISEAPASDMFWDYAKEFETRFPNKIKSFNLRYSYMTWKELIGFYEKTDSMFKDAFIKSVYVVLNSSRLRDAPTEAEVRQAIVLNSPTAAMLELFSQNYYFSPSLVDFYFENYYQLSIDKQLQTNRTANGIVTGTKLDDIISVSIDSQFLNTAPNGWKRGYCGLGSYLPVGMMFYPDIITTEWTGVISKAYNSLKADNIALVNLKQIEENAYYNKDIGLSSDYNGTQILGRFVPIAINYNRSAYEYQDIYLVTSDWIYIQNSKSQLDNYITNDKGFSDNEYIYTAFIKSILEEPICVLTDYTELVNQFEKNKFIDSTEAEELLEIGRIMEFVYGGSENEKFFNSMASNNLANTTTITLVRKLKQFVYLNDNQKELLLRFIDLFYYKVISPSSLFILSEYNKKTEGSSAQIPTAAAPATQTTWNWRFKTEEEFIDQYGDDWKSLVTSGVTEWEDDMDYLLGQPIIESDESKEYVDLVIHYDTGYGFDLKRFGILRQGGKNAWEISADMIINEPLQTTAAPAPKFWSWRFKTEQEFVDEIGSKFNWRQSVEGQWSKKMDYLLGQRIQENFVSKNDIDDLQKSPKAKFIDTAEWGIDGEKLGVVNPDNKWGINITMLTQDPLPTAAAPAKSEPKKRGRKPKSELPEIDLGGLEDIADIDIDDIDFDNLVI